MSHIGGCLSSAGLPEVPTWEVASSSLVYQRSHIGGCL
ncbi:unnamed protein product [Gulo gulo]|uniref:Uncharacterized protein n=1 Tax=Gulo gulo TaxID=48420 RepID=A0A9X9LCH4_GULGU|nr:unnamed protein product [Gulo gulo]